MKFSFKFASLLGTVYQQGNLQFSPDGNCIFSPVGNKITCYDLKNNKSETFPIEARTNIIHTALSPDGRVLILSTEDGNVLVCSMISKTVIHKHHFKNKIHFLSFSPDGKYFAIARGNCVYIFNAPGGMVKHLNMFYHVNVIRGFRDEVTCIDWTSDSRMLLAGSGDMSTRIACVDYSENLFPTSMHGHNNVIVNCYFEENSLNFFTLSRDGVINVWSCSVSLNEIITVPRQRQGPKYLEMKKINSDGSSDEDESEPENENKETGKDNSSNLDSSSIAKFTRTGRHVARKLIQVEAGEYVTLTASAYHRKVKILVTGFSNGSFFLHEMPEFVLIKTFSIAEQSISSICFNDSGDWIGLASSTLGQLVVWEWQSEAYILKQQGHFNNMWCVAYSPDGQYIVTGGDDGKVKVWNVISGFCFVTFTDHTDKISGVTYIQSGKAIISASFDGTVRCFDLSRYRNFRTFTSPRPTQFSCLAVDVTGEIVCAGGTGTGTGTSSFDIFVWSMKTSRLLEILTGHTSSVSSLSFSSTDSLLVSASWDGTFRIWDVHSGKGRRESVNMMSDVLAVSFRPDGREFAVTTLTGLVAFFDLKSTVQTGCIEGKNDLGSGRRDTDLVTAKQVQKANSFSTLCYSADGECILAAGRSKNICIYHVKQQILLKKFEITLNRSLDAMDDFISRRKMTEFGNMALIEERETGDGNVHIALPGVKRGDMASRSFKPEVQVTSVQFSPTGRNFAATTTEGLLLYSLDKGVAFEPMELGMDITISSVKDELNKNEFAKAVMMALQLNEKNLITEVLERVKVDDIEIIISQMPERFVERLLVILADHLEKSAHLEFYLKWIHCLLMTHGPRLKENSVKIMPLFHHLHRAVLYKYQALEKICDHNKYLVRFIKDTAKLNLAEKDEENDIEMKD